MPIPAATWCTSAPNASQIAAISLMNEIFVARNAFEAYLIISAVRTSVIWIGTSSGSYSSATRCAASASVEPSTTRAGRMKLITAEPSWRNSGFETTATSRALLREVIPSTSSPVPIGTVLLLMMIAPGRSRGASRLIASRTPRRSAAPSCAAGVPTATNTISASSGSG